MALPLLNETPLYTMTVPSTGKKIKYRPYLVKEEKVLLMANESQDKEQILNAIIDTITACTDGKVKTDDLTTFDMEYIFIKLRAKSVGETVTLYLPCDSCKQRNEVMFNLDDVQCPVDKDASNMIQINKDIYVEMRYPNYRQIETSEDQGEIAFNIIASCLKAVITEDERIDLDDETPSEIKRFLDSMTTEQFRKVSEFVKKMPRVEYTIEFDCSACSHHNEIEIKGMQNFF